MEDPQNNPKGSTDARVEHITVPDGDGLIRWNIINRGSDASDHGAGHDTDGGGADLLALPNAPRHHYPVMLRLALVALQSFIVTTSGVKILTIHVVSRCSLLETD